MQDDEIPKPLPLATVARALWLLNHDAEDPAWYAMAPKHERAEYEAMAERFLRLVATV